MYVLNFDSGWFRNTPKGKSKPYTETRKIKPKQ